MADEKPIDCPDCHEGISRRDFVRTVGGAAVAGGLFPLIGTPGRAIAAAKPSPKGTAETAAKRLFDSLNSDQRKAICFPFDHPLRKRISANWAITPLTIEDDFNREQQ